MEHIRNYRGQTYENKWIYGYFYKCKQRAVSENESCFIALEKPLGYGYNVNYFIVKDETVGQYSGVKDKNGVEMYEGDIVYGAVHWLERYKPAVVTFRNGSFGLLWYRGDIEEFNPFTSLCNVEYEVVGNIYDNPELMKECAI